MNNTNEKKIKVIFLDIDGVVNCENTFQRHRGFIGIDPHMAFMVGKIQLDTDCEIVLSSSWRGLEENHHEIERQVAKLYGMTPYSRTKERNLRGYEIKDWLDEHPEVTDYVILDDDSDMLPEQMSHFFQTSWKTGITKEIAEAVTKYLKDER